MPPRDDAPPPTADSRAPRSGLALMAIILAAFLAVSIFAHYQKAHLRQIEQVTIGPAPSPIPAPSRPPVDEEQ